MRHILVLIGLVGVTIVWLASAYMNYQYKIGLSGTAIQEQVYGIIAVAFDVLKAILPIVLVWSIQSRKLFVTFFVGVMLLLLVPVSVMSTMGLGAQIKAQQSGKWMQTNERLESWKSERKHKREKLNALPIGKNASAIESQMQVLRQDRKWTSTKKCTDATAKKSRTFCKKYNALDGAKNNASAIEKLEKEIIVLNKNIADSAANAAVKGGDAEAVMLAEMIGLKTEKIQTIKLVGLAFLVELISGMGYFVMFAHGGFEQKRKEKQLAKEQKNKRKQIAKKQQKRNVATSRDGSGSVATGRDWTGLVPLLSLKKTARAGEFAKQCGDYKKDEDMPLTRFYEAYEAWCMAKDQRALSKRRFAKDIGTFLQENNWKVKVVDGEPVWLHMTLKKTSKPYLKAVA